MTALFLFHLILTLFLALVFALFFQSENEKESEDFIFLSLSKACPDRVSRASAAPIRSTLTGRSACQGIRVPATKKKSAIMKVMALILFYLIFITFGAASRSAFRTEVQALFFENVNEN